ncbi:MAG: PilT/PilU family type 4a pilus ATPase, partial [Actinomycetes bacterium]
MNENPMVTLPVAPTNPVPPSLPMSPPTVVSPLPITPPLPTSPLTSSAPVAPALPVTPPVPTLHSVPDAPVVPPIAGDAGIVRLDRSEVRGIDGGIELDEFLLYLLEKGGSDLHLTLASPPMIRLHGDLEPIPGFGPLTATQLQECLYSILTDRQKQRFEENKELDLAYELTGAARFRVNLFRQKGVIGGVLRAIPWEIKELAALNMPESIGDFAKLPRGLVLVTGPTGSGKSTTLAAIIDRANRTRQAHIMTIEDPVEFVHKHRKSVVNQREVGEDTESFAAALKHALRQDPDIILVGEMRDLETISIALTAAETGHLVFGTLHT